MHPSFKDGTGAFLRGRPLTGLNLAAGAGGGGGGGGGGGSEEEEKEEEWLLPMYYTPGTSETHYCALRRGLSTSCSLRHPHIFGPSVHSIGPRIGPLVQKSCGWTHACNE